MKLICFCFLLSINVLSSVKYDSFSAWENSGVKVLKITYDGEVNLFLPPTKVKEKVSDFSFDFELSRKILELRRKQLINRMQTVKDLGEIKAQEYLQRVLKLSRSADVELKIKDMEKELDKLGALLKTLNFYREQFLVTKGSPLILYY